MKIRYSSETSDGCVKRYLHVGNRKPFLFRDEGGYWGCPSRRQLRTLENAGNIVVGRSIPDERGGGFWFELWPR